MVNINFNRLKFEDPHDKPTVKFFCNDPMLPIYSTLSTGYSFEELAHILMTDDERDICKKRPTGVSENASFVIDLDYVKFGDIKCDDVGSWKGTGTKSIYFRLSKGEILISQVKPSASNLHKYKVLTRRYYIHSTYHLFHRIIVDIRGKRICLHANVADMYA